MASKIAATLLVITAAITATVFALGYGRGEADAEEAWPDLSAEFDLIEIQTGDLAFRRGRDGIADAVMTYGEGSRYSHVGVVVVRDGDPRVIHAIPAEGDSPGGVIEEPFRDFGAPAAASALGVYRISGLASRQQDAIQRHLESQLGKPFDLSLRASHDREQYCTELVVGGLGAAGLLWAVRVRTIDSGLMPEPVIPPEALLELPGVNVVRSEGG